MAKRKVKHRPADNNVKALYQAENDELSTIIEFTNWEAVRDFVTLVTDSSFWKLQVDPLPSWVSLHSNGDLPFSETKGVNEIWLCNKHWSAQVVLHELAHFMVPKGGHGPKFVRFYLDLIAEFGGLHYHKQYRDAFRLRKIRF